jgi:hypothetical protein
MNFYQYGPIVGIIVLSLFAGYLISLETEPETETESETETDLDKMLDGWNQ